MKAKQLLPFAVALIIGSCALQPAAPGAAGSQAAPLASALPTPQVISEPPRHTVQFEPFNGRVQNPERGFAGDAEWNERDYSLFYEDGYTIVYLDIRLDKYREEDLPARYLQEIDTRFERVRGSGVKVIVRFSYNDGPYPNPEPDASREQILRHILQVAPILQKNADVIVWMEAGFIGAWGEWHTSTNQLDRDPAAKSEILSALLAALPADRMVLLRYPMDIMTIFPIPLSLEAAFSGSNQARVGFHNDCFLSSPDDENTYARRGIFTREQEYAYLSQSTRFTPVGGESCAYKPPRSDCETALQEAALFHMSELNDGWHPDVLDAWKEQGCYDVFHDRLGYRFVLVSSTFNDEAAPGGILNLSVRLRNEGFASMVNPRRIHIVLDGPAFYQVELPDDPRFWVPSAESGFNAKLRVPADAPQGEYRVVVWMPDMYDSLSNDPRYAVRFANEGVWDEQNGFNVLAYLTIDNSLPGDVDPLAQEFQLIP